MRGDRVSLSVHQKKKLKALKNKAKRAARKSFIAFAKYTDKSMQWSKFHVTYYTILGMFAAGLIPKLMVSAPPQHGKSEGSTRKLPAFILGQNPDEKIAIASYGATLARKFNRDIQRIIDTQDYNDVSPETMLNASNIVTVASSYLRNSDEFEVVDKKGSLKVVGRGGALTGATVDTLILDDLYKDYKEGSSPIIRQAAWEWYLTVAATRLHNESKQLMTFTRWNEDDIMGRLDVIDNVYECNSWEDIEKYRLKGWIKINFEAIKRSEPTELDPRGKGEALWCDRHSAKKLLDAEKLDPNTFEALYQGNPLPKAGFFFDVDKFKTYQQLPVYDRKFNYTDTADTGKDKLLSMNYVTVDGLNYVTDLYYSVEPMEVTELATAKLLINDRVNVSNVESNNGGRSFARNVKRLTGTSVAVIWFTQSDNKEARINTNQASMQHNIVFPVDWRTRWPEFYNDLKAYKADFKANLHDDIPDVMAGIIEKSASPDTQIISERDEDMLI